MSEAIKPKFWVDVHMNVMSAGGMVAFPCISAGLGQQQENASLIAEAFNARDTTGLTPRQLVERVKELEEAMRDAEEYISGHTPTNSWGLLDKLEDADRRETLEKVRAALSKSLPNTVAEGKE